MLIALAQLSIAEGHPEENQARALALLARAGEAGAGLAILPEMWFTGFAYRRLEALAAGMPASIESVGALAARHGMGVIGGWPEREGDRLYNTAFALDGTGAVCASYRKVHLFAPLGEDAHFSRGGGVTVADLGGLRAGLALCYDLRFPELVRRLALGGASLVVVPAQWPRVRAAHLRTLLAARAIENQLFAVVVNRAGRSRTADFGGGSAVVGPRGELVAAAGEEEELLLADIDPGEVDTVRREISYLDDRVDPVDTLRDFSEGR